MDTPALTYEITNRRKGQDLVPPGHVVSPDRVNIRATRRVPDGRLVGLPGFHGDVDAKGEVYGESACDHALHRCSRRSARAG